MTNSKLGIIGGKEDEIDNEISRYPTIKESLKYIEKTDIVLVSSTFYNKFHIEFERLKLPKWNSLCIPVWHLFVIKLKSKYIRDKLQTYLETKNVLLIIPQTPLSLFLHGF